MGKSTIQDGQPRDNFFVASVMTQRDVIANILDKFTKAGISHSFQGNDLIVTASTVSDGIQEEVLDSLRESIIEAIKILKEEYKEEMGKTLSVGKEESESFDVVSNYSTSRSGLYKLTRVYDLPDSNAEVDPGTEKGEIRGNIPVLPKAK